MIASWSSNHRRTRDPRTWSIAYSGIAQVAVGLQNGTGSRELEVSEWLQLTRSLSEAVTRVAFSVIMAAEWAFTAVSRAILTSRMPSISPSANFGVAVALPGEHFPGSALGVDRVALTRHPPLSLSGRATDLNYLGPLRRR